MTDRKLAERLIEAAELLDNIITGPLGRGGDDFLIGGKSVKAARYAVRAAASALTQPAQGENIDDLKLWAGMARRCAHCRKKVANLPPPPQE